MKKVIEAEAVEVATRDLMWSTVARIEAQVEQVGGDSAMDPLEMIPPDRREAFREVFDLIYECSANRLAAKSLVDKIIQRLAA